MYNLLRPPCATSGARSISIRASSTLLLDAASISNTDGQLLSLIETQDAQVKHGVTVGPFSQLIDLARILAEEVLPQPRGPVKRYA